MPLRVFIYSVQSQFIKRKPFSIITDPEFLQATRHQMRLSKLNSGLRGK